MSLICIRCAITIHLKVNDIPSNCLYIYTQTGRTPLFWACENGLSDVAQLLINRGVNVDVTDEVS